MKNHNKNTVSLNTQPTLLPQIVKMQDNQYNKKSSSVPFIDPISQTDIKDEYILNQIKDRDNAIERYRINAKAKNWSEFADKMIKKKKHLKQHKRVCLIYHYILL